MKIVKYNKEARDLLKSGVAKLNQAVASTLGAAGRTVVIDNIVGWPHITKDGVTVAEAFEATEPFEIIGVDMVKTTSRLTNEAVGDGTTTAIVLANAFLQNDGIIEGHTSFLVKKGMDKAMSEVLQHIPSNTTPID